MCTSDSNASTASNDSASNPVSIASFSWNRTRSDIPARSASSTAWSTCCPLIVIPSTSAPVDAATRNAGLPIPHPASNTRHPTPTPNRSASTSVNRSACGTSYLCSKTQPLTTEATAMAG